MDNTQIQFSSLNVFLGLCPYQASYRQLKPICIVFGPKLVILFYSTHFGKWHYDLRIHLSQKIWSLPKLPLCVCVCVCVFVVSPTVCNPMDCSLPGSSVYAIFQAGILEWVAISFSRGSSWPRDRAQYLLHFLHWQVDSLPLAPRRWYYVHICVFSM